MIAGEVIVTGSGSSPIQHSGIYLTLEGMVNINLSTKNVGVFEAFYNSAKVDFLHLNFFNFNSFKLYF